MGSAPIATLFKAVHLSSVVGFRLADGREVVVKARPYSPRLQACCLVHHQLWQAGYPCPEPLVGPVVLGELALSAEVYMPGGTQAETRSSFANQSAAVLARLVSMAPAPEELPLLTPPLPWTWWQDDRAGTWPPPDDLDLDLNEYKQPSWLAELAERVRDRLRRYQGPSVIGHGDWESQNLRWQGDELYVVHDWDSVASMPEPMLAGFASSIYTNSGRPLTDASIEESAAFLEAYQGARSLRWNIDEYQVAWAAGLWGKAFDTKKATFRNHGNAALQRFEAEAGERQRLAGA